VPDELDFLPEHRPGDVIGIVVAIRSREDDDCKFHDATSMR
jgi:hypothetical protein